MVIKSIELADYRNYEELTLQFDRGTTILFGDNAQGKTNILEAVYVAATTKSHKGSKKNEGQWRSRDNKDGEDGARRLQPQKGGSLQALKEGEAHREKT